LLIGRLCADTANKQTENQRSRQRCSCHLSRLAQSALQNVRKVPVAPKQTEGSSTKKQYLQRLLSLPSSLRSVHRTDAPVVTK
jgi:hypothetical protein